MTPEPAVLPPMIGQYRIERELGRGGMGAVYVGVHQLIGRRAAIKVLLPQVSKHADLVQRFFNEARAATQIRHPGIVEVYDYGVDPDGNAYLVMEYLEGETLASRLRSHGRLHVPEAIAIARQIAFALGAAHRAGIVHRDLKPDNVFLTSTDGTPQSKLLDFGVAKLVDEAGTSATVTGTILGTPAYMSPEQCEGSRVVDHRSDLYSLGCTLFVMLTGRLPFIETGIGGLIGAHLHTPAPALRDHCAVASPELAAIVARLLAKAPEARFSSADELAAALAAPAVSALATPQRIAETPPAGVSMLREPEPTPPPMTPTLPPMLAPAKRAWWPLVLIVALVVAGAIAVAVIVTQREPAAPVETAQQILPTEPVKPPVAKPAPIVERPAEVTAVQAYLVIARKAAAEAKYDAVEVQLRELAKLAPTDPEVAAFKAEVAPAAIPVAAKRIAALNKQHNCQLMKGAHDAATAMWGKSPLLDRAATGCKADVTFDDKPTGAVGPLSASINELYSQRRFAIVSSRCARTPPTKEGEFLPCIVSACNLKQGRLAYRWVPTRGVTPAEKLEVNRAMNMCLSAGIKLSDFAPGATKKN